MFRVSYSGELAYEVATPAGYGERVWTALLDAGKAFDIIPYGLEAMGVMRVEKGHVAGPELTGQTTARDLGLERMMKKKGDFIGRVNAMRPGLLAPDRPTLVGVQAVDPSFERRLRGGAHIVARREFKAKPGLGRERHALRRSGAVDRPGLGERRAGAPRAAHVRDVTAAQRGGRGGDHEPASCRSGEPPCPRLNRSRSFLRICSRDASARTALRRSNYRSGAVPSPRSRAASVRMQQLRAAIHGAFELDLPRPGSSSANDLATAIWIAPETWLILRDGSQGDDLTRELAAACGEAASVVDQTWGKSIIRISGARARDVLAKGCRIDLHPRVFGPGKSAVTPIAHIHAVLTQIDATPTFDLIVPSTLARDFVEWLRLSAAEFGYEVVA